MDTRPRNAEPCRGLGASGQLARVRVGSILARRWQSIGEEREVSGVACSARPADCRTGPGTRQLGDCRAPWAVWKALDLEIAAATPMGAVGKVLMFCLFFFFFCLFARYASWRDGERLGGGRGACDQRNLNTTTVIPCPWKGRGLVGEGKPKVVSIATVQYRCRVAEPSASLAH